MEYAREDKCEQIIMVDSDLDVGPPELGRLLTHDVPIVCALYPHRDLFTNWHVQPFSKGEKVNEQGLMRVRQSAVGFSKIKLSVFDDLMKAYPDRVGQITNRSGGTKRLWDFFAFELVGMNTPSSRLADIRNLCDHFDLNQPASALMDKVLSLANTQYLAENSHFSEDYFFCRLCVDAGIPIFLDTNLIAPHETGVKLPLPTTLLFDLLKEPWRQSELELIGKNQV